MNTTVAARSAAAPPTRSVAAVPSRNIPPEMNVARTDAPSGSGAASIVAIKNEYDADTDDEAVLPASCKNSVNDAASMVAIKKEYDADTDDEEGNVANQNSVSNVVASMVAVNKDQERKKKENFLMFIRVLMK